MDTFRLLFPINLILISLERLLELWLTTLTSCISVRACLFQLLYLFWIRPYTTEPVSLPTSDSHVWRSCHIHQSNLGVICPASSVNDLNSRDSQCACNSFGNMLQVYLSLIFSHHTNDTYTTIGWVGRKHLKLQSPGVAKKVTASPRFFGMSIPDKFIIYKDTQIYYVTGEF